MIWKLAYAKGDESAAYVTATVARGDIQNLVTAIGTLQPRNYVDVGAQVSGQLKKLYVAVGSEVKAGDLLAEIDATVYKAKVDGIRAQLLNQKAQLQDKQAQLTLAQIRFERQKNLQADDATTKESVQTAEATLRSAQAQLQSLEAQIKQTDSSLRAEEANLEYARIYAPIDGTVVTLTSRQGQTLNANQQAPTIMRIADLTSMTVQTQVSEADIGKLKIDMPVYFTTLGNAEQRWYGKLNRIEPTPTVTNNVVLYNALFDVPNDNRVLMTQMSTQVFFVAASAKDSLLIPASAVNFVLKTTDKNQASKPAENKEAAEKNPTADAKPGESRIAEGKPAEPAEARDPAAAKTDEKTGEHTGGEHVGDAAAGNSKRRRGRPETRPQGMGEASVRPATVYIVDEKKQLVERHIKVGISNRVDVQVLEGLSEGETLVSGMRQTEKSGTAAAAGAGMPGAGPGTGPGATRMMR
ncbi:MAG TPA: efflux RND transporter periplasmic adaptor subunit [Cellvibrio sp.]|nr:efflux RND transporter periplasmic adaptor subunit [Cellvibrio sp.]